VTVSAASVVAQVLPALLVVGLLGPLLLGWKIEPPERIYFASHTLSVLLAEVLLYCIIRDQPLSDGLSGLVQAAVLYSLIGIAVLVLAWAKSTSAERAEADKAMELRRRARGELRRSARSAPNHASDSALDVPQPDDLA